MQLVKIKGTGFGVYKRTDGRFLVKWKDGQNRDRQSTFSKAVEANDWCRRKYREWPGKGPGVEPPYSIAEMVGEYMETREARPLGVPYKLGGIAENTLIRDRSAADRITARWDTESARALSKAKVERWYESMADETPELSDSTIAGYAGVLRKAYRHAMRPEGPLEDLTVAPVPGVPVITRRPGRAFTAEQTWAILDRFHPVYRAFTYTLAFSGMRIEEVCRLDVPDFDPVGQELRGGVKTEAGIDRPIAISDRLAEVIAVHVGDRVDGPLFLNTRGNRITADSYRAKQWDPVVTSLGIPEATPHWFRHTAATLAAENGNSVWDMMSHFGWTDPRQATRYVHLARKGIRRIADSSIPPAPLHAVGDKP